MTDTMTDPLGPLRQRLLAFAQARDWLPFHSPKNLASALAVEAAELLEPFQWLTEAQSRDLPPADRDAVVDEMADVFIYLLQLCNAMDVDLLSAAQRKIDANEQRYPVALSRGHNRKAGAAGILSAPTSAPPPAPSAAPTPDPGPKPVPDAEPTAAAREVLSRASADAPLFRQVVEAAPNGLLLVDAQGRIRLANRKAEELLGYGSGALAGLSVQALVPETLRAAHVQQMAELRTHNGSRAMGPGRDVQALRADGTQVPVEIGLNPITLPEGRCVLASIIDISDRHRRDEELRRSNAELAQFAYVASHDLQEPLRMVASYTELLAQRYQGQLDERADKYIYYAVDGARRMQQLVADLLTYSRVGSQGKPLQPVALDPVLQRVLRSLGARLRDSGGRVEMPDELPTVMADEGQLEQLLQNLIGNALKFHGDSPPVVRLQAQQQPGPQGSWVVSVADNGIGIEPQYHERIFQMFQRLHERGRFDGSGIGLAVAQRIVHRHGGRLWVSSEPGVGSCFSFTWPAVPPGAGAAPAAAAPPADPAARPGVDPGAGPAAV